MSSMHTDLMRHRDDNDEDDDVASFKDLVILRKNGTSIQIHNLFAFMYFSSAVPQLSEKVPDKFIPAQYHSAYALDVSRINEDLRSQFSTQSFFRKVACIFIYLYFPIYITSGMVISDTTTWTFQSTIVFFIGIIYGLCFIWACIYISKIFDDRFDIFNRAAQTTVQRHSELKWFYCNSNMYCVHRPLRFIPFSYTLEANKGYHMFPYNNWMNDLYNTSQQSYDQSISQITNLFHRFNATHILKIQYFSAAAGLFLGNSVIGIFEPCLSVTTDSNGNQSCKYWPISSIIGYVVGLIFAVLLVYRLSLLNKALKWVAKEANTSLAIRNHGFQFGQDITQYFGVGFIDLNKTPRHSNV